MTTLKIEPVSTKSVGGLDVEIDGINLGTSDLITGMITGPARKWRASWDEKGICRDNDALCNLDTSADELSELINDAKGLSGSGA